MQYVVIVCGFLRLKFSCLFRTIAILACSMSLVLIWPAIPAPFPLYFKLTLPFLSLSCFYFLVNCSRRNLMMNFRFNNTCLFIWSFFIKTMFTWRSLYKLKTTQKCYKTPLCSHGTRSKFVKLSLPTEAILNVVRWRRNPWWCSLLRSRVHCSVPLPPGRWGDWRRGLRLQRRLLTVSCEHKIWYF